MSPDHVITFLQNMDLFWLVLAFAGGAFGAMIGGNNAFAFTGVTILLGLGVAAGTGSTTVLDYVSFGPVFGPHIAFAGGVAASAYAAKQGLLGDTGGGKDVNSPLAGLGRPDVLFVGACFGALGYIIQRLVSLIPWFGTHTDAVALTVVTSGIIARIVFGKTPVVHSITAPDDKAAWLRWQEKPAQLATIALFASMLAAGIAMMMMHYIKPLGLEDGTYTAIIDNAHVLPFALSAITIFFVAQGAKFPVTHHMTVTAAVAAATFFKISGSGFIGLLAGVIFGVIAAFVVEYAARLMYNHGDTHIDPPAAGIWLMNTAVALCALPFAN